MPDRLTFWRWLEAHPEFRAMYTRARLLAMESMADEILQISDDGLNDTYWVTDGAGVSRRMTDYDVVNRSKLRVETRKWLMGKLAPLIYGDLVQQRITGADGGPLTINVLVGARTSIATRNADAITITAEPERIDR